MNNIRQIIEERLDNARNDWLLDKRDYLRGQMVSYRDCLNLMQPRTEDDILKDFEKLGYKIVVNNASMIYLTNKSGITLHINKLMKWYGRYNEDNEIARYIYMQEHKLLNELFEVWQWI